VRRSMDVNWDDVMAAEVAIDDDWRTQPDAGDAFD